MNETQGGATVRPATVSDAKAIIDLHFAAVHRSASGFYSSAVLESWSRPPDEARYLRMRAIIAGGDELVLVAQVDSGVVAFGSIVPRLAELRAVYVRPDVGRLGIGAQVLTALEDMARERGVSELHMNASLNAEAFYHRAGYEVVGHGVHRLGTGQEMPCVAMRKRLSR